MCVNFVHVTNAANHYATPTTVVCVLRHETQHNTDLVQTATEVFHFCDAKERRGCYARSRDEVTIIDPGGGD